MLPGLRFLFAAIVLAISLLVFGLGAAALFRAAHEEFASIPARRAPPEPQFAQQPETPPPVLAMVRVDQPAADKTTTDVPAPSTAAEPAVSEPAAPAETPAAEPKKLAAVKADDAPPPATPRAEPQAVEAPAPAQSTEIVPQPPTPDPSPASQLTPAATEAAPAPAEAKSPQWPIHLLQPASPRLLHRHQRWLRRSRHRHRHPRRSQPRPGSQRWADRKLSLKRRRRRRPQRRRSRSTMRPASRHVARNGGGSFARGRWSGRPFSSSNSIRSATRPWCRSPGAKAR